MKKNEYFQSSEWQFIQDSQDVDAVFASIGKENEDGFPYLFVKVDGGEYVEVWGTYRARITDFAWQVL